MAQFQETATMRVLGAATHMQEAFRTKAPLW